MNTRILIIIIALFLFSFAPSSRAGIIETGIYNVIDQVGNPSNGLSFLDISFSVGLSREVALANARLLDPLARLATLQEHDYLAAEFGVNFNTSLGNLSQAFTSTTVRSSIGLSTTITSALASSMIDVLGVTRQFAGDARQTWVWSPIAHLNPGRYDVWKVTAWQNVFDEFGVQEFGDDAIIFISGHAGYLIIANNQSTRDVPEPSSLAIFALGMMGLASRRFKKQA